MKVTIDLVICTLFFLILMSVLISFFYSNYKKEYVKLNINNKEFTCILAVSETDIVEGMMGKTFDNTFNGMLFVCKGNGLCGEKEQTFWMKNCIIPLDIVFIKNGKISQVYDNCPPCHNNECQIYKGYGEYVLELHGGTCIRLGIEKDMYVYYNE